VVEIVDVGKSLYSQFNNGQKIKKLDLNIEDEYGDDHLFSNSSNKRMIKLLLSDGFTNILAAEMEILQSLSVNTPLGSK
ncbi:MAG: hypothetical protein MHPSP_004147, partial [Paramarteilia canceri]